MKTSLKLEQCDSLLYATITGGRNTPQETLYHMQKIANAANQRQCDRVLIEEDVIPATTFSREKLHALGKVIATLRKGTKLAIVDAANFEQLRYAYSVSVAAALGIAVKTFSSVDEGRAWLKAKTCESLLAERTLPASQRRPPQR